MADYSIQDAIDGAHRTFRKTETALRGAKDRVASAVGRRIPQGVKDTYRELRGYRTESKQRRGDIHLSRPRKQTRRR